MIVIDTLSRVLAWVAAALFTASGFMLTYEVSARYLFTKPTIWAAELSQLCLIWGSLIAMPWALGARRHITISALTDRLGGGTRRSLEVLVMAAIIVFSLVLVVKGWEIFHDSLVRGRTTGSLLNLPVWIAELAVPVGFALLALQAAADLVRLARGIPMPMAELDVGDEAHS